MYVSVCGCVVKWACSYMLTYIAIFKYSQIFFWTMAMSMGVKKLNRIESAQKIHANRG